MCSKTLLKYAEGKKKAYTLLIVPNVLASQIIKIYSEEMFYKLKHSHMYLKHIWNNSLVAIEKENTHDAQLPSRNSEYSNI